MIDKQVGALVSRLTLPDDWRARLEELTEHREERNQVEGKRRYLAGKLRRLREVYVDGDLDKGEYNRRKAKLQAELDALQVPAAPEVEEAGAVLESLADAWGCAGVRLRAQMLATIFESVAVDLKTRRVVSVKPWPPFVPLFRMDGLDEREKGVFYVGQEAGDGQA